MNQQQQLVRLPEPSQMGQLILRGATNFAKRNKVVTGFYFFGWIFLLFVGSGTQLTIQQQRDYNAIMNTIDLQAEYLAENDYWNAKHIYESSRGWFWSCATPTCQKNYQNYLQKERMLKNVRNEGAARMSDAKRTAGLFSTVGVNEMKDSFWTYFYQGKQFAKRQSMWDALFIGIRQLHRGREETWIEYGLKVLIQVLINFTMGLIMSLIFFIFGLWGIVKSYQPNPIMAVFVFCGATAAAFAYVSTYLMAIYGATAGGIYGVLKVAESTATQQQRLHGGAGAQQRRRMHYE